MGIFDLFLKKKGLVEILVKEIDSPPEPYTPPDRSYKETVGRIEITDDFATALEAIDEGFPLILLTGSAGTGKSTFIRYFCGTTKKRVAIVSPTGVAALIVGGKTIHSLFKLPPRYIDPIDIKPAHGHDKDLFSNLDILIIDEISMVRADLMDAIELSLRINAQKRKSKKAFGGVQVVMVGDLFQLPPVLGGKMEKQIINNRFNTKYFFSAFGMKQLTMLPIEFTKCYRQNEDDLFFKILQNIRKGHNVDPCVTMINNKCISQRPPKGAVTLTCTRRRAQIINEFEFSKIQEPQKTYYGEISGNFNLVEHKLPSPMELRLKNETLVMFTKNGGPNSWVNGTIGKVIGMEENSVFVETIPGGAIYEVGQASWDAYEYYFSKEENTVKSYVDGTYKQIPLMHAWAMTIHKAQGKTIERLHIDLTDQPFETGQIYVALSRCPSLDGITINKPLQPKDVMVCPTMQRFYKQWATKKTKMKPVSLEAK